MKGINSCGSSEISGIRHYSKLKGHVNMKTNCQAMNSSKKRTNEFVFTTMKLIFVCFLEEIEDTKKPFEIT